MAKSTLNVSVQVNEAWLKMELEKLVNAGLTIEKAKQVLPLGKYLRVDAQLANETPNPPENQD